MKQLIRAPYDSPIVQFAGRLLVPLVQLFAVYVLIFGQYGPGGGFVAGVMVGASFIVGLIVFGTAGDTARRAERALSADGVGLLIFAFVGGLCMIGGGRYLDYSGMPVLGLDPPARRFLGILLTQVGVAVDVAVAAISIVFSLSRGLVSGDADA